MDHQMTYFIAGMLPGSALGVAGTLTVLVASFHSGKHRLRLAEALKQRRADRRAKHSPAAAGATAPAAQPPAESPWRDPIKPLPLPIEQDADLVNRAYVDRVTAGLPPWAVDETGAPLFKVPQVPASDDTVVIARVGGPR